jgi:hypothetical protein
MSSNPRDYRGILTDEKADRLIAGWPAEDVVLAITGGCSLIRDHTIRPGYPLPSTVMLEALARRLRAERHPGHGANVPGCASCERSALGLRVRELARA